MKFSEPEVRNRKSAVIRRRSEQAYVMAVHRRLRKLGVPCKWEAALLGRSVDLVFLKDGEVHTVEFKLKDWRRGIDQARDHQLGADVAYLCLPDREISAELRDEAVRLGIGLLILDPRAEWPFSTALEAKRSRSQWPVARERLLKQLDPPAHA